VGRMENRRVLVVEDDEPIRSMLVNIIERMNFDVEEARDGAEAIECLDRRDDYDAILLDLMMPRVTGWDVLAHMRSHHPADLRHTIIASAVPPQEIAARTEGSVFGVHPKPFDITRLLQEIRTAAAA
jgi:CheY-like chemotaxis protein